MHSPETPTPNGCVVCVLRHHELVVIGSTCIAVWDRQREQWLDDHSALDERVSLEPTVREAARIADFELRVHTFGMELVLGPVLAVIEPSGSTLEHIGRHARLRHAIAAQQVAPAMALA